MTEQPEDQTPEPDETDATGSGRRPLLVGLGAVLAVIALGGGLYFGLRGGDQNTTTGTVASTPDPGASASEPPPASLPKAAPTDNGLGSATPVPGSGTTPAAPGATTPDSPGSPADVKAVKVIAEAAVAAINTRDDAAMRKVSCDPELVNGADQIPPEAKVVLNGEPVISGDTATVEVVMTIGERTGPFGLPLTKRGDSWCLG